MKLSPKASAVVMAAGLVGIVSGMSYTYSLASQVDALYRAAPPVVREYRDLGQRVESLQSEASQLKPITPHDTLYHPARLHDALRLHEEYAMLQWQRQALEHNHDVAAAKEKVDDIFSPSLYYALSVSVASAFLFVGGIVGMNKKKEKRLSNVSAAHAPLL